MPPVPINMPIVQVLDDAAMLLDQRGEQKLALELDALNPANEPPIGGPFAVSVDQMIKALNDHLQLEYASWHLYKLAANLSLGPFAAVVAEEMNEHARDEESHIDLISRKVVTMGGVPVSFQKPADWKTPQDITEAIEMNYRAELDAVNSLTQLIKMAGPNEQLVTELQNVIAKEAEHAEDLKKMRMYDSSGLKQTHKKADEPLGNPAFDLPVIPFPAAQARAKYRGMSKAQLSKELREALISKDTVSAEIIEEEMDGDFTAFNPAGDSGSPLRETRVPALGGPDNAKKALEIWRKIKPTGRRPTKQEMKVLLDAYYFGDLPHDREFDLSQWAEDGFPSFMGSTAPVGPTEKFTVKFSRGWGTPQPITWNNGDDLKERLADEGYFPFGGESLDATGYVIDTKHPAGKKFWNEQKKHADPKMVVKNDDVMPGLITLCTMSG